VKILLDQNISFRIIENLKDVFPDLFHVREQGLENSTDQQIWNYARKNSMAIVTFDADFYDLSIVKGHPPKVIWLRTGNKTTNKLEILFRKNHKTIEEFLSNPDYSKYGCLEIH
jgi:predicted nuclease of predicted toxin-antitoxin system